MRRLPGLLALSLLALTLSVPPAATAAEGTLVGSPSRMWQTNGTVWALVASGGVLYVGGDFTSVRPPGAAPGTGEVSRQRIAAFDAATGDLLAFSHAVDNSVKALAVSPDGARLYAGGTFTTVDGVTRRRAAAFGLGTGALVSSWRPTFGGPVGAIATAGSTVYLGGSFTLANAEPRSRLAAVSAAGELLAWTSNPDGAVRAMTMTPDGSRVIVGGSFSNVNGAARRAIVSLDAVSGEVRPWAGVIPSCSQVAGLTTAGDMVYGAAEGTGGGCFDGSFAADPMTGVERWRDLCLGATQSVAVVAGVVYKGSHAHDCGRSVGGFPEVKSVRTGASWHLLALNVSDGAIRAWTPNTNGLPLGPRVLATDGAQLFVGGDFTTVNGRPQQGLTRFAAAPDATVPTRPAAPVASSVQAGRVTVSWTASTDLDDETLRYRVYRDGGRTPVAELSAASRPWVRPVLSFDDVTQAPGSTHTYRVDAVANGNASVKSVASAAVTVASGDLSYADTVRAHRPAFYWRLGETSGGSAADSSGQGRTGNYVGTLTRGLEGAIPGDGDTAVQVAGGGFVTAAANLVNPQSFSIEAWVRTTTTTGGKIVGFGNSQNGNSSSYDRHVYMTNAGELVFGVYYPSQTQIVRSAAGFNDGRWHHLVATMGGNGMALYVDGAAVGTNPTTFAQRYTGYWRAGGDSLGGWPSGPSRSYFTGALDEVAMYPTVLSPTQVASHYDNALTN